MEEPPEKRRSRQLPSLTDKLLVEILRRLPIRSLCRFKCVSRSWRKLISDPNHRKKLAHTLVGFFYQSSNWERSPSLAHHFTNVTGKGKPFIYPSFSYLPVCSRYVSLRDCCNGLLLCCCYLPGPRDSDGNGPFNYAVCNPATEKWVMLPPHGSWPTGVAGDVRSARLGFDPTVSSDFHVIAYVVDETACSITGVEIYSSKTAVWSFKESKWGDDVMLDASPSVFLNGFMHVLTYSDGIIVVDMEGKIWRKIPTPPGADDGDDDDGYIHEGSIRQSQGHLCFFNVDIHNVSKLSIWILEDYGTNKWTLKHTVSTMKLFRQENLKFHFDYKVIAVHPECNLIFFVFGSDNMLMAYEMDRSEVRVIRNLGHDSCGPYLPYVPSFSDSLADEH